MLFTGKDIGALGKDDLRNETERFLRDGEALIRRLQNTSGTEGEMGSLYHGLLDISRAGMKLMQILWEYGCNRLADAEVEGWGFRVSDLGVELAQYQGRFLHMD